MLLSVYWLTTTTKDRVERENEEGMKETTKELSINGMSNGNQKHYSYQALFTIPLFSFFSRMLALCFIWYSIQRNAHSISHLLSCWHEARKENCLLFDPGFISASFDHLFFCFCRQKDFLTNARLEIPNIVLIKYRMQAVSRLYASPRWRTQTEWVFSWLEHVSNVLRPCVFDYSFPAVSVSPASFANVGASTHRCNGVAAEI